VPQVSITVNGAEHTLDVEPRDLLVYVLRERLGLTGTNVGCDTSSCGACTVLLDGESVKSCTLLGVQVDGHEITTIEGLATNGAMHPVQEAFHDQHGLQCGYCTPGFIMATVSLLEETPNPTEEEIRHALEGNLANHDPDRDRKLLLHRKEVDSLAGSVAQKGLTLVPTKLYFKNGRVKVELALARGKEGRDKRRDIAKREADRDMQRAIKARR
jgi:carbon-monoxide dehydrogenase small subunit